MNPNAPPVLLLESDGASGPDGFRGPRGWNVHPGFDLPTEPWDLSGARLLCLGTVGDAGGAEAAMTAVARGAGIAVAITLRGAARHRFLEDLHTLAQPIRHRPTTPSPTTDLSGNQEHLLEALASGATVTSAAANLHISRRTANRLLEDARTRLGVDTNAGAARRWLERRPPPNPGQS